MSAMHFEYRVVTFLEQDTITNRQGMAKMMEIMVKA